MMPKQGLLVPWKTNDDNARVNGINVRKMMPMQGLMMATEDK